MALTRDIVNKEFYALEPEFVFEVLETHREGLTEEEAARRRLIFGENIIPQDKKLAWFVIFLRQFK